MAEQQVHEGEFFLNVNPDNRHTGVLTIFEDGRASLKIFGSFNTPSPAVDHSSYTIWGQTFNGHAISILNCSRKEKTTTYGVAETETWGSSFVLLGGLVADRSTPFFITVSAEIDGMREWVNIDGGELSFNHDGSAFDYKYEDPKPIAFQVDQNINGFIYFKNRFTIGLDFKHTSEQVTRIHFQSSDNLSFHDYMMLMRSFRNLISLFIGQKVRIRKFVFTSKEVHEKVISPTRPGEPYLKDIELFFYDNETYGTLSDRQIYFVRFGDIAPDFENIIKNWMALNNSPLAPVTGLLLDAIIDHSYFEENDFLKAWQGVEAFHRIILQDTAKLKEEFKEWYEPIRQLITDKKSLKKLDGKMKYGYEMPASNRLMQLLKANSVVLHLAAPASQMDYWIKEMSNTRNYLTHFEPGMAEKKANLQHIVYYTSLLKAVLVVLVLRHLGVREELLAETTKNSIFYYRPLAKVGQV